MKLTPSEPFNEHLDTCSQCESRPFDLCPAGQKLLEQSAELIRKHLDMMKEVRAAKKGGPQ